MVDAGDLKSPGFRAVRVRVPSAVAQGQAGPFMSLPAFHLFSLPSCIRDKPIILYSENLFRTRMGTSGTVLFFYLN